MLQRNDDALDGGSSAQPCIHVCCSCVHFDMQTPLDSRRVSPDQHDAVFSSMCMGVWRGRYIHYDWPVALRNAAGRGRGQARAFLGVLWCFGLRSDFLVL